MSWNNELLLPIIVKIFQGSVFILIGMLLYRLLTIGKLRETKSVKKQAFTDQLTGRGNRYLLYSVMDNLIKKNKKFAVCFMDLDGFKQINDTMGHDAGDELLKALSNLFDEKLPKNSTAYRLGGDEFAIIIKDIKTTEDVTVVLDNLKKDLTAPVAVGNTNISLEYSLGVAIYPEDASDRQELIMYADDAMYYIKEHGKNNYYFHNKTLKAKLENKTKMELDLKRAYENHEFGVYLQPRINVKDTSKICFEALLYWNHPTLGKLQSSYFINQAEEMALMIHLDQYVLNLVCDKIVEFKEKGFKNIQMAVNISNKHATKDAFVDRLCEIISSHNLEQGEIQIELVNPLEVSKMESYRNMFDQLKKSGADIIINNLELKYESLELINSLPIDEIKIASDFITEESNFKQEVFGDIIKLSHDLRYKVIVGRIDDDKKLIKTISSGADKIQGDFLFKKMEQELAEEVLNNYGTYRLRIDDIILNAQKSYLKNI
ncbi:MAG: EAL domain-containing protein [Clostridia bacterium]|nr:EAL domain-containing protein [Clostridia bacterium]